MQVLSFVREFLLKQIPVLLRIGRSKMTEEQIKEVRRTYLLARAVNTQYQFIREFVNDDLRKAINEAKAKNAHFIKILDGYLQKRSAGDQIKEDEELAFILLEELETRNLDVRRVKSLNRGIVELKKFFY